LGENRVRVEPEDQRAVERLARYIMQPPISLERVEWGGEGVVHYRAKGGHDGRSLPAGDAAEAFDPAEFSARVIMHIPAPRRHLVRYYGWYSELAGSSASWPTACRNGEPTGHALMTGSR
jgi:hypothetical protein